MEIEPKIELKEMPNKELLEKFLAQMILGKDVEVYFDYQEGRFIEIERL